MRKILVVLLAACAASPALADWTGKDATGATITFKNPGVCSSVVCVPISSLVDATGAAVGTAGAPLRIDPTGTTTQPVSMAAVPTGGSTSANQTTEITALNSIVTNTGAAIPACSATPCVTTIGNMGVDVSSGKGTPASVAINVSTATTTQLVAISGSTKIYVTSFDVIAGGTGNITFEYGTGATCGTGTTALTGAYNLTAQAGISKGSGVGAVLVVPSGNALCVLTSAAVQISGSVSYQQF